MRLATLGYIAVLFLMALAGHTYFFHLTERVSLYGFSALETMVQMLKPENFIHDFSSGNVSGARHSILSRLYAPLHQLTGASGITLLTTMIGFEIASVIAASWVLWNALVRRVAGDEAPRYGVFCWVATTLVAGFLLRPNLSNFGYPFFHGQFYGFADATTMVAIAMALRKRWAWCAVWLCIGFMIHPTKTLMAALCIGGFTLGEGLRHITRPQLLAGIATGVFFALWGYFWFDGQRTVIGAGIPVADYLAYTRGWQYHWYPIDRGLLDVRQHLALAPFLALVIMGALALRRSGLEATLQRQLVGGLVVLGLLTLLGLYSSYALISVFMVKMAWMRASELLVLLLIFCIGCAVYAAWRRSAWLWAGLFSGFLLSGMISVSDISILIAVAAVALHLFQSRNARHGADWLLAIIAIGFLGIILAICAVTPDAQWPWHYVSRGAFFVGVAVVAIASPLPRIASRLLPAIKPQTFAWLAVSGAFILLAAYYFYWNFRTSYPVLTKARDYYAVQLWARDHTRNDALFMVDPCTIYGWRDFSERSSLGTPYEWFHTGWLYVGDKQVFDRGQAIGKSLGMDFADQLPVPGQRAKHINTAVCQQALERFYDPSSQYLRRVALEHKVDYFVVENEPAAALLKAARITPLFTNAHYTVIAAKDL